MGRRSGGAVGCPASCGTGAKSSGAFAEGKRRVFADTDPENAASNRLLETLGFRREGLLRAEWETHIGVRDSVIWGLLREEWQCSISR